MKNTLILSSIFLATTAVSAAAQCPTQPTPPVIGPTLVCFTASPDHSATQLGQPVVAGYKLVITDSTGAVLSTTDLGKPALSAGNVISVPNFTGFSSLVPGTQYTLKTVVYGPGGTTPDGASAPFGKVAAPAAAGTAVVTP